MHPFLAVKMAGPTGRIQARTHCTVTMRVRVCQTADVMHGSLERSQTGAGCLDEGALYSPDCLPRSWGMGGRSA